MSNNNDYRRGLIKVLDDHSDPSDRSFFRVGLLEFQVPPSDITVSKKSDYSVLSTMRAPVDMLFKSGYAEYDIQVRLYYFCIKEDIAIQNWMAASEEEWKYDSNNPMRSLIGMYKTTPITIIYNSFIADQIYGAARLKTESLAIETQDETSPITGGNDFIMVPVVLDSLTIRIVPDFSGITYEAVLGAKYYNHSVISPFISLEPTVLQERMLGWNSEVVKRGIQQVKEYFRIDSSEISSSTTNSTSSNSLNGEGKNLTEQQYLDFFNDENNAIIHGSIYTSVGQKFGSISDEVAFIQRQLNKIEALAAEEEESETDLTPEQKQGRAAQKSYYEDRKKDLEAVLSEPPPGGCSSSGTAQAQQEPAQNPEDAKESGAIMTTPGGTPATTTRSSYLQTSRGDLMKTHRYPVPYGGSAWSWNQEIAKVDFNTGKVLERIPAKLTNLKVQIFEGGQYITATRIRDGRVTRHKGIDYNVTGRATIAKTNSTVNFSSETAWVPGTKQYYAYVPVFVPAAGGVITAAQAGAGPSNNSGLQVDVTFYDSSGSESYVMQFRHLAAIHPNVLAKKGSSEPIYMGFVVGWVGNTGMRETWAKGNLDKAHLDFKIYDFKSKCYIDPDKFLMLGYEIYKGVTDTAALQAMINSNNPWEYCELAKQATPSVPAGGSPTTSNASDTITTTGQTSLGKKLTSEDISRIVMGDGAAQRMEGLFLSGWLVDVHKSTRTNTVFYKDYQIPFVGSESTSNQGGVASVIVGNKIDNPKTSLMLINNIGAGFVNKIATIPIAGQSLPFHQHLGGSNINIVIEAQALADETNGLCSPLLALQSLYSIKEQQILDFVGRVEFKPQNVYDIQTVKLFNLPLNNLGIFDVIMSDLQVSTTPGSPHVYQVRLSLVENFFYGYELGNRSLAQGLLEGEILPELIEDAILKMTPDLTCLQGSQINDGTGRSSCYQLKVNNRPDPRTGELTYTLLVANKPDCQRPPKAFERFISLKEYWFEAVRYKSDIAAQALYSGVDYQSFTFLMNLPTQCVGIFSIGDKNTRCYDLIFDSGGRSYLAARTAALARLGPTIARLVQTHLYLIPFIDELQFWGKSSIFADFFKKVVGVKQGYPTLEELRDSMDEIFLLERTGEGAYYQWNFTPDIRRFIESQMLPGIAAQLMEFKQQGRPVHVHQITDWNLVEPDQISLYNTSCQSEGDLVDMYCKVAAHRAAKMSPSMQLRQVFDNLSANKSRLIFDPKTGNISLPNNQAPITSMGTVIDFVLGSAKIGDTIVTGGIGTQILNQFLSAFTAAKQDLDEEAYRKSLTEFYLAHRDLFAELDAMLAGGKLPDKYDKSKTPTNPIAINMADLMPTCYPDLNLKSLEEPAGYLVPEVNYDYLGEGYQLIGKATEATAAMQHSFIGTVFKKGIFTQKEQSGEKILPTSKSLGTTISSSITNKKEEYEKTCTINWFADRDNISDLEVANRSYEKMFRKNPVNSCPLEVSEFKSYNRSFPTFKVFLIEDNEGDADDSILGVRYSAWDNFYDYNAIQEIEVARFRHEPDVAVIKFLNTYGILTTQVFGRTMIVSVDASKDKSFGEVGYDPTEVAIRLQNGTLMSVDRRTGQLSRLSKMFLQAGTKICIKMGYVNNETELPIVFSGLVTEIQPGPVVTVVAQGHASELTNTYSSYEHIDQVGGIEDILRTMLGLRPGASMFEQSASILSNLYKFLVSDMWDDLTFKNGALNFGITAAAIVASFFSMGGGLALRGLRAGGVGGKMLYGLFRTAVLPFRTLGPRAYSSTAGFLLSNAFKLAANVALTRSFAQELSNIWAGRTNEQGGALALAGLSALALYLVLGKFRGIKAMVELKNSVAATASQVAAVAKAGNRASKALTAMGTGIKTAVKGGLTYITYILPAITLVGTILAQTRYFTRQFLYLFRGILIPAEHFDKTIEALDRQGGASSTYRVIDLMLNHPGLLHYGRFSVNPNDKRQMEALQGVVSSAEYTTILKGFQKDISDLSYLLVAGSFWHRVMGDENLRAMRNVDPLLTRHAVKSGMDDFDDTFGAFYITNPGSATCFDIMYTALLRNPTHIITTRPYGADATLIAKRLGDTYITSDLNFAKGAEFMKAVDTVHADNFFRDMKAQILEILGGNNSKYECLYNIWLQAKNGILMDFGGVSKESTAQTAVDIVRSTVSRGVDTRKRAGKQKIFSVPELLGNRYIQDYCGLNPETSVESISPKSLGEIAEGIRRASTMTAPRGATVRALLDLYQDYIRKSTEANSLTRTALDAMKIRPVCKVFYVSDIRNLIYNNINTNENIYNAVTFFDPDTGVTQDVVKIDDSIVPNYVKSLPVMNRDAIGGGSAVNSGVNAWLGLTRSSLWQYNIRAATAFSILKETVGKMYRGELAILGNGEINPYDAILLDDQLNQMSGKFLVDSIIHRFTPSEGFVSFIEPKMILEVSDATQKLLSDRAHETLLLLCNDPTYRGQKDTEESVGKGVTGANSIDYDAMQLMARKLAQRIFTTGKYGMWGVGAIATAAGITAGVKIGGKAGVAVAVGSAAAGLILPYAITSTIDDAIATDGWSLAKLGRNLMTPTGWSGLDRLISGFTSSLGTTLMNATMFRHPMMFYPLLVKGVPFVAGVRGLSQNTLADHYLGPLSAMLSKFPGEVAMFRDGMRSYMKPLRHVLSNLHVWPATADAIPPYDPALICEPKIDFGQPIPESEAVIKD